MSWTGLVVDSYTLTKGESEQCRQLIDPPQSTCGLSVLACSALSVTALSPPHPLIPCSKEEVHHEGSL
jgi:hypothetical protein